VLGELLPAAASAAELFHDPPRLELFPEEAAAVARAVEVRRREFTTGRHCARIALGRLGHAPSAITKGARGEPCWPDGIVGSITHCVGYRAAAVARVTDIATIGIDAEPNQPLPAGILERVSLPQERARLAAIGDAGPGVAWDRLLFSAKESVYKAWAPVTGLWLDFDGADIAIDPVAGTFTAVLLCPGADVVGDARGELRGRYAVHAGLIVTAIAHARSPVSSGGASVRIPQQGFRGAVATDAAEPGPTVRQSPGPTG
jgi:4'-phosphopantetheinyl transferase EntD